MAQFLGSSSPEGFPRNILRRVSETQAVYITGTVLHVHTLHVHTKDELNLILLATHFHIVKEVRLHTCQTSEYYTSRKQHLRVTQSPWRSVAFLLPYICRGDWVENNGTREREIKITFDEFFRHVAGAWKVGLSIRALWNRIPESEVRPISRAYNLSHVHRGVSAWAEGYSLESDLEVDLENDERESREQDEMLMLLSLV